MKTLAVVLALSGLTLSDATAQDDVTDLDADPSDRDRTSRRDSLESEVIREIVRGYYLKSSIGSTFYLGTYSSTLQAGTALGFAVGSDFLDNEKSSAAWEVQFSQGVHNGTPYENQVGNVPPESYIQGDTRTFLLAANVEYSAYVGRRFGIGARVGGGVMLSPLNIEKTAYAEEVERDTFGVTTTVHNNPHPIVFGGPTFEYYTKLSHFSLGADVDVSYALGFDLGLTAVGYLKYTF